MPPFLRGYINILGYVKLFFQYIVLRTKGLASRIPFDMSCR